MNQLNTNHNTLVVVLLILAFAIIGLLGGLIAFTSLTV